MGGQSPNEESPKGGGHLGGRVCYSRCGDGRLCHHHRHASIPPDPASVAADTARHFWKAGNIQDPKFQERYDELINKSRGTTQGSYSQDFLVIVHWHRHQAGWVLKGRLAELFPAGMSMILLGAFLVPLFETDKWVAENCGIDGMCLDIEGNIIATAGWESGGPGPMIYVFSPDGRVLELIQ